MKRIYSFLFAILTLAATTGVFTSCQEDAPAINYTINITVNNDFTEVVNAINNGTMKQEAAIAALTAAINGMNGEQNAKMDAIVKAINDLAKTTDAKLAIIEAAMKAQTLALEAKLALLETAIKNIPDYSEKMAAIEAAIKNAPDYTTALKDIKDAIAALPNYTAKLGAIVTAIENLPDYRAQLTAIKDAIPTIPNYEDQLTALETALEAIADRLGTEEETIAAKLQALSGEIAKITAAVEAGNTSQDAALAEIIALLKSGALAGGGSGSGSGGEGSGDEPTGPYISFTTEKSVGSTIEFACDSELTEISGVDGLTQIGTWSASAPIYQGTLTSQEVKLYGTFTKFNCDGMNLTKIDTGTQSSLEVIELPNNPDLEYDFKFNTKLRQIYLKGVIHTKEEASYLVENLPDRTPSDNAKCTVTYDGFSGAEDLIYDASDKGWIFNLYL